MKWMRRKNASDSTYHFFYPHLGVERYVVSVCGEVTGRTDLLEEHVPETAGVWCRGCLLDAGHVTRTDSRKERARPPWLGVRWKPMTLAEMEDLGWFHQDDGGGSDVY